MHRTFFKIAILGLALFISACAEPRFGKSLVVVLPDEDGKVGAVTLSDGKSEVLLDQALAAAKIGTDGTVSAVSVTDKDVDTIFGPTIAAQPIPPRRFRLYFVEGTDDLTKASMAPFDDVFRDIRRRPAYDVEVTGHTDTQSSDEFNAELSLKRANKIREKLMAKGIGAGSIVVYGRGEWDLLIPTADNVDEPRNRRVEITVR